MNRWDIATVFTLSLATMLAGCGPAWAQPAISCPSGGLRKTDVIRLAASQVSPKRMVQWVEACGVAFELTPEAQADLEAAGAPPVAIDAIRRAGVSRRPAGPPLPATERDLPEQTLLADGDWRIYLPRGERSVTVWWAADPREAMEFVIDSNGWWHWRHRGLEYVVFSDSDRKQTSFFTRPWENVTGTGQALSPGSAFIARGEHGTTRVVHDGRALQITLPDGGLVELSLDGPTGTFSNYKGRRWSLPFDSEPAAAVRSAATPPASGTEQQLRAEVRKRIAFLELDEADRAIDQLLKLRPGDVEALAWRARVARERAAGPARR